MSTKRYRFALRNPLVGWRNESGATPKDVHRSHKQLYSPTAERRYTKKLQRVPLDIEVVLGNNPSNLIPRELTEEARRTGKTILYINEPTKLTPEDAAYIQRHLNVDFDRGVARLSSMTAFTLLHRMGDIIYEAQAETSNADRLGTPVTTYQRQLAERFPYDVDLYDDLQLLAEVEYDEGSAFLSSGVDTAAGRKGLLFNWQNVIADLWAKYLISGRVAYDPHVRYAGTPMESYTKAALKTYLENYFPIWKERARGMVFAIGLADSVRDAKQRAVERQKGEVVELNPRKRRRRGRRNPRMDERIVELLNDENPDARMQGVELARVVGHSDEDIVNQMHPTVVRLFVQDRLTEFTRASAPTEHDVAALMWEEMLQMSRQKRYRLPGEDQVVNRYKSGLASKSLTINGALANLYMMQVSFEDMRDVLLRAAEEWGVPVLPRKAN